MCNDNLPIILDCPTANAIFNAIFTRYCELMIIDNPLAPGLFLACQIINDLQNKTYVQRNGFYAKLKKELL